MSTKITLHRVELQEIAQRIHQRTAQAIIENGQDLLRAKAVLPHGEFTAWLQHSVDMSERTAQRCMQVAEWVASLPEGKSDTVSVLAPKQLYLLSAPSTPGDAQERVLNMVAYGIKVGHAETLSIVNQARRRETKAASDQVDAVIEEPEILEPPPKPENRRRTSREVRRDRYFDAVFVDIDITLETALDHQPSLTSEETKLASKYFDKIEANLRRLRRKIEKQHPEAAQ